jgi:MFS family permease
MRQALASTFSVDFRAHPAFVWWFANRMLFWAAFIALSTFLLFFMIDVVGMGEADAQKYVGTLSTLLGAALVIVTLPSGWVADRVGRKPVVIASGVVAALGAGIILLSRDINLITAGGVVVGLGVGVFMSANWALVTDIVPRAEAARYLGIANIATAGGSAVARFLGGALIDPLNKMLDSTSAGYFTVYAIAAGFFLLSALVIIPLPSSQTRK